MPQCGISRSVAVSLGWSCSPVVWLTLCEAKQPHAGVYKEGSESSDSVTLPGILQKPRTPLAFVAMQSSFGTSHRRSRCYKPKDVGPVNTRVRGAGDICISKASASFNVEIRDGKTERHRTWNYGGCWIYSKVQGEGARQCLVCSWVSGWGVDRQCIHS